MGYTPEQYKEMLARIEGKRKAVPPPPKVKTKHSKADYKDRIWDILQSFSTAWVTEHKFHLKRKWRFDWAHKDMMIAVEYEGIYGGRSRHTSVTGYVKDTEKYNNAQILGWKVLRYTASNYKDLEKDLKELFKV